MTKPTIIFHHIPKTAGSTFLHILNSEYQKQRIYQIDGIKTDKDIDRFKCYPQHKRDSFDLIMGHQAILLKPFINKENTVISFFRNPIDQFISSYFYLKTAKHNKHHNKVAKLSLAEYLDYTITNKLNNPQAKVLFTAHYEDINDQNVIAKRSQTAFDEIDLPCLTEDFNISLMMLKRELKWKKWPFYSVKNKSLRDEQLMNEKLLQKHRDYNQADFSIYEMAKTKFKNIIQDSDRRNLKVFSKLNSMYSLLYRIKSKI